jgi:RNA-directed DNA polymerase
MTIPLIFRQALPPQPITVHSSEFYEDIKKYAKQLTEKKIPVIFSVQHLALLAGVNIKLVVEICESDRIKHYKRFKLKKRNGGFRTIYTPNEELKYLQRWILVNILEKSKSHENCKGFDKKTSIKLNAEQHLNKEAILKADLLRFYDSITEKQVYRIFKGLGYHGNVAVAMAKICTLVPDKYFLNTFKKSDLGLKSYIQGHMLGVLPQGAPTSPKLSNLLSYTLDHRCTQFAKKNELNYTRYADDLTFSGSFEMVTKAKKILPRIIKDERYFINHAKTKILRRGAPFFITGLSVHDEIVKVPKKRKTDIEHHLYHCQKNGVQKHLATLNINKRNFKDWLFGSIAYVYSIEKELGEKYFTEFHKIQWPL